MVANMPQVGAKRTVEIHGYALRAIRDAKGIKAADLADMLNCDRSYITRIELGHNRRVSVTFYNELTAALGIADARALYAVAPERDEDAA